MKTSTLAGLAAATLMAGASLAAGAAHATQLTDPRNDRLPTFTNNPDPTPDLDVVRVSARYTDTRLILSATMAGDIGTSDAGEYVWGIDRGQGSPLLSEPNPLTDTSTPIGANIPFDAFLIIGNGVHSDEHDFDNGGLGVLLGPYNGAHVGSEIAPTGAFMIDPGAVHISGRTITLSLDRSLLPSTGFDFTDFTYNLWPRYGTAGGGNGMVTDFAPDNQNFKASAAVPEPAAWAFMIMGFGLVGTAMRRRQLLPAA
jgi:hypothetical protein